MKATERSDKLPRNVTIELMKICKDCECSDLEVNTDKVSFACSQYDYSVSTIRCQNEGLCRNIIRQNEDLYEKWSEE